MPSQQSDGYVDDSIHIITPGYPDQTLCGALTKGRNVVFVGRGDPEPDWGAGCWMCISNLRADRAYAMNGRES